MGGLVESITGNKRVQAILMCWLAPLLIGAFAFVIVVLPDVRGAGVIRYLAGAARTLHINTFLFVFAVALVAATFLFFNRLPLWRVLEGYLWPGWLCRWRVEHAHAPQARYLRELLPWEQTERYLDYVSAELKKANVPAERERLSQLKATAEARLSKRRAKLDKADKNRKLRGRAKHPRGLGKLPRRAQPLLTLGKPEGGNGEWLMPYPTPERLLPTKLGNLMRSMESYGADKYGLDTQIMWFELLDLAPASLQSALEDISLQADTLVCGVYTALGLAAAALAAAAWRASAGYADAKLWITSAVSAAVSVLLYHALLGTAVNWSITIKSLVDGSRDELRQRYGLRAPDSAADEKQMWEALVGSRWYDHSPERLQVLTEYRVAAASSPVSRVGARRRSPDSQGGGNTGAFSGRVGGGSPRPVDEHDGGGGD